MKNLVRVERARKEISQAELAKAVRCNRHTINALETKRYIPNGLLLVRIAKYFNVPVEELFILEGTELEFDKI